MPQTVPAGPYEMLDLQAGLQTSVPLYVIPFDKEGVCTAPQTRAHLLQALRDGAGPGADDAYTDVIFFSHGWNNDWETATARYKHFIEGYAKQRSKLVDGGARKVRPLLIGVFWPSTALVLPSEQAPDMANASFAAGAEDLLAELPPEQHARAGFLLGSADKLNAEQLLELATLLAPLWNRFQHVGGKGADVPQDPITPEALAALWQESSPRPPAALDDEDDDAGGYADDTPSATAGTAPGAAFSFGDVLAAPRNLLRVFTVLQMKDRAVRVGGAGVSALLQEVMQATHRADADKPPPSARIHLIGHSYGCIVVLSALVAVAVAALPRQVDSVLLLQAAVSRWCFAERVPGMPYPGGYRPAFDRVRQPILSTYTRHDAPLTKLFHLAVRRESDLGQPKTAAPTAPSKYAALGGYGPAGCADGEVIDQPILAAGNDYDLDQPGLRLIALQADDAITGHGEISVSATWWALQQQIHRG